MSLEADIGVRISRFVVFSNCVFVVFGMWFVVFGSVWLFRPRVASGCVLLCLVVFGLAPLTLSCLVVFVLCFVVLGLTLFSSVLYVVFFVLEHPRLGAP